jgi:hypothetical protein
MPSVCDKICLLFKTFIAFHIGSSFHVSRIPIVEELLKAALQKKYSAYLKKG